MTDLLDLTAELVDIPSVSKDEEAITSWIEARLREQAPWLEVTRLGNNLVARTNLDRGLRVMVAGHTDTVPVNDNADARIDGDTLFGLGSCDMKGGLAVALDLATSIEEPALDVTFLFYECEEIALEFNGLRKLLRERPDLLACDAAILGEPTGGLVEAGCQGTLRASLTAAGERAHTARPWMGRNAIHRLGPVIAALAAYEERRPVLNDCEFREALQAVGVKGGVAGNVVPDAVDLLINHRFAPDRTTDEAIEHVRDLVCGALDGGFDESAGDRFEVLDAAAPAPPDLDHPVLAALVTASGQPPRAKLGWTDVSFFAAAGIPATNFGPGDPTLAHTKDERVERADLERVRAALSKLLVGGIAAG
ncbi:MAG TPA: succinyl-diaminopimelate desuccinylase [Acidimicrobiales bacterium]|nr:succinyl-diaminopimelate desuccinylase [Acidimicrobiales bacterium]